MHLSYHVTIFGTKFGQEGIDIVLNFQIFLFMNLICKLFFSFKHYIDFVLVHNFSGLKFRDKQT